MLRNICIHKRVKYIRKIGGVKRKEEMVWFYKIKTVKINRYKIYQGAKRIKRDKESWCKLWNHIKRPNIWGFRVQDFSIARGGLILIKDNRTEIYPNHREWYKSLPGGDDAYF